jgi:hypothetical protein
LSMRHQIFKIDSQLSRGFTSSSYFSVEWIPQSSDRVFELVV